MLTKTYCKRLIKVCKVLFPRYKYIKINSVRGIVTMRSNRVFIPIISWFLPCWKVTLTELINYQIPNQLADFKYNNKTFISVIQEELIACDLMKKNRIDYFLEEITKIKFVDIHKQLRVPPGTVVLTPVSPDEDEVYETIASLYQADVVSSQPKSLFHSWWTSPNHDTKETLFYIFLLLIIFFTLLI